MKISFTISKALAVEAVKSETYIKGSIDVASNQGSTKLGFNETAGDIEVHERKLSKDFVRGVERLIAHVIFHVFLRVVGNGIGQRTIESSLYVDDDACVSSTRIVH